MIKSTRTGLVCAVFAVLLSGCRSGGDELQLVGTVERPSLEVAAPISEVIVEIPVKVGDRVTGDQIVVQLDSAVAEADLAASEAALAAANAAEAQAQREYGRIQGLQRARVSSRQDLDKAQRARDEAIALVAERTARRVQSQKRLADLTLRSWGEGTLDELPFEVGERTSAGSVVAVVLADEEPYVRVWVPARAASHLRLGTQARVDVEGLEDTLSGVVEHIARESDFTPHYALTEKESAHLVYETRIRLIGAPDGLRPGLPARVELNATVAAATGGAPEVRGEPVGGEPAEFVRSVTEKEESAEAAGEPPPAAPVGTANDPG